MEGRTRKLIIFWTLYFITKLPNSIEGGKQEVGCVFFFGDSLSDNGNNNLLVTLSKANYSPYGIDYPDGPTGRFSNGKNIADFLAEFLGFEEPVPAFSTAKESQILNGVNYASGGAGILDLTGEYSGARISMNEQLLNHASTALKIARSLGNTTLATDHLNKCLYVVNIGSNDYINSYLLPQYFPTSALSSPKTFASILSEHFHGQLRMLYNYGARKVAVFGLGLIGLIPQFRSNNYSNGSFFSIDSINKAVNEFNIKLKPLIHALNTDLHGAHFILINTTNIALQDPSTLGIRVSNSPCCVVSKISGLCEYGKTACSERNEYYFWDNYHPTEIANAAMATRAYAAPPATADAYPTGIRNLLLR